ncbi:hypothetical protein PMG11_01187 [Penicillium brasilianum]|uniref:HNH nuclease domain-containing protein n=1 Tax=Penicillium brasilianum TaxID=104259 RepID=A0A0F7TDR4_PENBI|nr:hypothetical protein PMG11_01187 [Penicillium brasilianum]
MPKYALTTIKRTIDKQTVGCHSVYSGSIRTVLGNNQDPGESHIWQCQEMLGLWGEHGRLCACFAKEDDQTDRWDKARLIPAGANFKSKENAIFLCKSCHCQFDNTYSPGIVFFPADLEFFIEQEKADQACRKEAARNGAYVRRSPPTGAAYKAHQVGQGRADPSSIGGLYRIAIMDTFHVSDLPKSVRRDVLECRSQLKPWHGEPIYTIRRAFIILGTLQVKLLDPEIKRQLRELQDLYTSDDLEDDDDDSLLRSVNRLDRGTKRPHPGPEDENNTGGSIHGNLENDGVCPDDARTSPNDGSGCLGESDKRLKRGCRSVDETALTGRDHLLLAPHRTLARRWRLGPDLTTEDAIRIRSHISFLTA